MKKVCILLIFLLLLPLSPPEIKANDLWRYDLEKAISFSLKEENLSGISELAKSLKGATIQESAWNILEWEEKNIEYDFDKAQLPEPVIRYWNTGETEIIQGKDNIFQLPYETILRRRGVCKDYTLLTAGLLLETGHSPIFILDINFLDDPVGHTATGISVNGWFFVLDQHTPVMDTGTYYKNWLGEDKIIDEIILYRIDRGEELNVTKYRFDTNSFKNADYRYTSKDPENISNQLMIYIRDNFSNLKVNRDIAYLDKASYLPEGYKRGKTYYYEFPDFLESYNPIFHYQFMKRLYRDILRNDKISTDLKGFSYFYMRAEGINDTIRIILNLAS